MGDRGNCNEYCGTGSSLLKEKCAVKRKTAGSSFIFLKE
jgi:hypothetical protein